MRTESDVLLRVVHGDGSGRAVCSDDCAARYQLATFVADPHSSVTSDPAAGPAACAHCGWCGRQVRSVPGCERHSPKGCPRFDWTGTEAGRRLVVHLQELTGGPLSPRAYEYIDEVAGYQNDARTFPNFTRLVDGMMDRRVDW